MTKIKDVCLIISTLCLVIIAISQYKNTQAQQQMTVVSMMQWDSNLRLEYIKKLYQDGRTHEDILNAMYSKPLK